MKPGDLTEEEVRYELEKLMEVFPERKGSVPTMNEWGRENQSCVYYLKEDDSPIIDFNISEREVDEMILRTPVCIVGQWIEEFHPEFKEDVVIRSMLAKNTPVRHAELGFDPDVHELLRKAQVQQDKELAWGDIDLDTESENYE